MIIQIPTVLTVGAITVHATIFTFPSPVDGTPVAGSPAFVASALVASTTATPTLLNAVYVSFSDLTHQVAVNSGDLVLLNVEVSALISLSLSVTISGAVLFV